MKKMYSSPLKAGQGNGICAAAAMQQELGLSTEAVAEALNCSPVYLNTLFYNVYSGASEHRLLEYFSGKLLDYQPTAPYCHIELDLSEPHLIDSVPVDFTGGFLAYTNFMRYKHKISISELAKHAECPYYIMKSLMDSQLPIPDTERIQHNIELYLQELEENNPKGCDNANCGIARYKLTIL